LVIFHRTSRIASERPTSSSPPIRIIVSRRIVLGERDRGLPVRIGWSDRTLRAIGTIVLAIVVGCGSGSDGSRSGATTTETPGPTVAEPTPSTTPTVLEEEILLAVGEEFSAQLPSGPFVSRPVMLRKAGEGPWTEVDVPALPGLFLHGVVFSTPDTGWAFGFQAAGLALLRSDDRGESWRDVSAALPALGSNARAFDLVFADDRTAYLAVRMVPFGATLQVFVTHDGSASWSAVEGLPVVGFGDSRVALLVRDGVPELLRSDLGPPRIEPIDGATSLPQELAPAGSVHPASSASTVGARGWAAVTVAPAPSDPLARAGPAIFSSVTPGERWVEQPIEAGGSFHLRTIDVCPSGIGVAGGATALDPVVLHTTANGERWLRSTLEGLASGTTVQGVLCTRGESAWAITIGSDGIGSLLLHSTDNGATWAPATTPVGERTQLRGLARSTERE
jgi:hypothetical protein